jgi:hypothetical protein
VTATIWRTCPSCGVSFEQPDDPSCKRVYCSRAYQQAAYRARQHVGAGQHSGRQDLASEAQADRAVAGMSKVSVPVDVHQAVAAASAQRQPGTDQQAAVASEHQRRMARGQQVLKAGRQPPAVVDQRILVAHSTCGRVAVIDVAAGKHDAGVDRTGRDQPCVQPSLTQRLGSFGAARDAARLGRP